jgi:CubicO group peptidase (beta-lactamase class C family)
MRILRSEAAACILLGLALAGYPAAQPAGAASAAVSEADLVGRWYGVARESEGRFSRSFPVEIEIVRRDGHLFLLDRDRIAGDAPAPLSINALGANAVFPGTVTSGAAITLRPGQAGELDYRIDNAGPLGLEHHAATLSRDPRASAAFRAPRLDAHGQRTESYAYWPPVARADGFPVASAHSQGVDEARLAALVRAVLRQSGDIDQPQIEGILILRNGKLILEEYFWGQSADNPHMISSCTKSLTSMITGAAWDRGLIDLDKPAAAYFPDYPDSLWAKEQYPITVRNILSMDSGTQWEDSASAGRPSKMLEAATDIADYMLNKPLVAKPGSRYNYDNGLPALQGRLIENATKQPFAAFADRALLGPLGITNYSWMATRDHGRPLAAGGVYMRPIDAAKLGQVMLDRGLWKGKRILSEQWVAQSTTQQTANGDYPYGFYWHLTNEKHRHVDAIDGYGAIGQGGQFIMVLPAVKAVVVITSASWRVPTVSRSPGTPLGLINEHVVPAFLATGPKSSGSNPPSLAKERPAGW